ncbi:hypothetical protein GUJ93_ZPchr0002g25424 [Zizania palustris]|uniref:Uncharacterized protein n=1 Tax=Zizania palustris TaxID=103762 RepID=A0A8J5RUF3_ZIZPA|nr:hypothetical protein GUJ93_ZPchr0002g25424 [Zizania palustris]
MLTTSPPPATSPARSPLLPVASCHVPPPHLPAASARLCPPPPLASPLPAASALLPVQLFLFDHQEGFDFNFDLN